MTALNIILKIIWKVVKLSSVTTFLGVGLAVIIKTITELIVSDWTFLLLLGLVLVGAIVLISEMIKHILEEG